jgi:hypothetical protein
MYLILGIRDIQRTIFEDVLLDRGCQTSGARVVARGSVIIGLT